MQKRKIALCLSGHLRTFGKCYDFLYQSVILPLKPDIFIHSWQDTKDRMDSVLDIYKPLLCNFEYYNDELAKYCKTVYKGNCMKKAHETNVEACASMTRKVMLCNELKQQYEKDNNFLYDIVIKARFDVVFSRAFNEQDILLIDNENIVVPHKHDYRNGLNDMFAMGNSKNMDLYSSLHKSLAQYGKNGILFHQETMLKHHIKVNNLGVKRVDITMQIIRD